MKRCVRGVQQSVGSGALQAAGRNRGTTPPDAVV